MKKDALPDDSAKDIQLLFSRAGMTGAKYREFSRQEPAAPSAARSIAVDAPTPGPGASPSPSPSSSPSPGPRARANFPALEAPAPPIASPPPLQFRGAAGASSAYTSLERIFADRPVEVEAQPAVRPGVKLAILSLAGGVGKTTLAVTLARILSSMSRQALVADCGPYPIVAHHFGSRGQRLGPLQFFFAPAKAAPIPVGVFKLSLDNLRDREFQDLVEQVDGSETMMLIDLPTLQGPTPGEALAYANHVLVPVTPDVHSVGGVAHLQALLAARADAGHRPQVHYLINRFDESRALHREVRGRLQQLLGESLLPLAIHEDEAIEEAAAHGMTIVDHRPDSPAAREFVAVANWLCDLSDGRQKEWKEGLA